MKIKIAVISLIAFFISLVFLYLLTSTPFNYLTVQNEDRMLVSNPHTNQFYNHITKYKDQSEIEIYMLLGRSSHDGKIISVNIINNTAFVIVKKPKMGNAMSLSEFRQKISIEKDIENVKIIPIN